MKIITPVDTNQTYKGRPGTGVSDLAGVNCRVGDGTAFYSLWKPDENELALIVAGHPIMVGVLNDGKPIFPIVVNVPARADRVVDALTPAEEAALQDNAIDDNPEFETSAIVKGD